MVMAAGIWRLDTRLFPIRFVRVQGSLQHLRLREVEQALRPLSQGYWSVDLDRVADAVRRIPWVEAVVVRRVWPDVLELVVREQEPVLRWGRDALLNRRGEAFKPETLQGYRHLPGLTGPANYRRRLFRAYHSMNEALRPLEMRILELEVDSRRSWRMKLDGGMEIQLGRVSPEAVFARLVRAMTRLGKDECRRIERLDGRYEHGFAVRWQRQGATRGGRTLKLERHG